MNKRKIFFYNGKPPFYLIPLAVLITLALMAVLAVFGFFIAVAVGVVIVITGVMRFLSTIGIKNDKKVRKMDPDGRNIILEESDYEVLESEDKHRNI